MNSSNAHDSHLTRDEVVDLVLSTSGRVHSVKMILRSWLDPEVFQRARRRYARVNLALGKMLQNAHSWEQQYSQYSFSEDFIRVWFRYPNGAREEFYSSRAQVPVEWGPAPVVRLDAPRGYTPVPIVPPGWEAPPHVEDEFADFDFLFHPAIAEFLEPIALLGPLRFIVVGAQSYLARQAVHVQGVKNWRRADPVASENAGVADEYHALVDVESGILLRFACVLDGIEFCGQEVTYLEVELDERVRGTTPDTRDRGGADDA